MQDAVPIILFSANNNPQRRDHRRCLGHTATLHIWRERLSGRSGRNNHRPGGTDDNQLPGRSAGECPTVPRHNHFQLQRV